MTIIYKINNLHRLFAILAIMILIFSMFLPCTQAYAILPVLAASPEVAGLLAKIIVTAGITYVAADAIDYCVDAVYGNLSLEQQAQLQDLAHSGRYVIDAATGAYKYVIDVTQDVWDAVHDVCSSLWDVGTNDFVAYDTGVIDASYDSGLLPLSVLLPITVYSVGSNGDYYLSCRVTMLNDHVIHRDYYKQNGDLDSQYDTTSYGARVISMDGGFRLWYYKSSGLTDGYTPFAGDITYGQIGTSSAVTGIFDEIDNLDYNWNRNDDPNDKRVVFWPTIPEGSTLDTSDTSTTDVIDYDLTKDELVGATADDIASEDVSGVPVSSTTTVIDDTGEIDTPTMPEAGSEGNTSLKALFFSKFPFCLPWDLMNAFKLLLAPASPPKWEVDIIPPVMKEWFPMGDTTVTFDMGDYPMIGVLSRFVTLITFCISLIVLTRKIIRS